jgi:hypothetical protein
LNQLVKLTEDYFIEHQGFIRNDPVGILQMVYYHTSLVNLKEFCLEMICLEPEILFDSAEFVNLPAPLLEVILKRNDLNLVEIKVWENLIKWGLAQEKSINKDVSKWDQETFNTFEIILHKFIPLIRFHDISSEDYFNQIKPYEEILPKKLQEEILKFHIIPEYKPTCMSRSSLSIIINRIHFTLIANWIDRKEENVKYTNDIPYEFNLLYRASRDGNTAAAFHTKCDDKGATIVVVKIKNSKQIVGGYNPLEWYSSGPGRSTKDSFIYSFTNKTNLQSAKVAYSNGGEYSIHSASVNGPVFGNDLYVNYHNNPDVWCSYKECYSALKLPRIMNVVDYEVFQVIKKHSD